MLLDGDLACDGGTFNNFPADVMRRMRGVGKVIGVDLSFRRPRQRQSKRLTHLHCNPRCTVWACCSGTASTRSSRRGASIAQQVM